MFVRSDPRATSSVVAVALLAFVAVLAASGVAVTTLAVAPTETDEPTHARIEATADAEADRIALTHQGGETVDVGELRVVVSVEDERLTHQPPVPFFAATGFESGPTGPFNVATDDRWRAGQTASVTLASTNSPGIEPGDTVTVRLYQDEQKIAAVAARAD